MATTDAGRTGPLDRARVAVVAKLLAKAERTEYEAEALALVERAYSLMAEILTFYDEAVGSGGRRRERRLLRDRRRSRRDAPSGAGRTARPEDVAARYRRAADDDQPGDGKAVRKVL